jgi:hypothetical protein
VNRQLSDEAFVYYAGLGAARSYSLVAKRFNISRRTVANTARRDDWQSRLAGAADEARKRTDERIIETLEDLNVRHLKVAKFVLSKGLESLRGMTITKTADALRAVAQAVELERAVLAPSGPATGDQSAADGAEDARAKAQMIREFLALAQATVPPPPEEKPAA